MRVALILCNENVLRLLLCLRLVNRTNLLSLSLTPEALEPEIVLGLDLALELDRALRLVTRVWNPRLRTNHISQGLKERRRQKINVIRN